MTVHEDRNRIGHDAAQDAFHRLVSAAAPASPIERASYLYGMQTFCRQQLRCELAAAMSALDECELGEEAARFSELVPAF